ncbi:CvpA family protein [Enterococcus dongliensis]|uniref:CvpA family protein n=1 Tax=Enterococcus dongliensis TaxID=2559925 RepID=A0AAP5NKP6_9ENTE|nr:CvpA family protein [Enterococcus dongliensis]MDT2596004.1 CvpA family protein [Enterococcus dongliensis]MDT2603446.1 CvpA family protein [Enterococcus dongliensis]MDT2634341.1 CvpA family protein [Enterococcus dongliensis]MDT2636858.1 CvpA family protein [Enterococcus dongliensis]MDT2642048.1 CvpA family protein [Enterococcus dongliensis]
MLTLIILFALLLSFYVGYRRGVAYQLVFSIGYLLSFIVARIFYQGLGSHLDLFVPYPSVTDESKMVYYSVEQAFNLDKSFYAGVAFVMILVAGWLVTHLIAIFFKNLLFKVAIPQYDGLVAGILQVIICYVAIFLLLKLISFVPMALVQNQLAGSRLARFIIEHSLFLSSQFDNLWVTKIIG